MRNRGQGFDSRSREWLSLLDADSGLGLTPCFYHQRTLQNAARNPYGQYGAARKADLDLLFSDALLGLARDLRRGRASRFQLPDSAIDVPEDVDPVAVVTQSLASDGLRGVVARLSPAPAGRPWIRRP